MKKIILLVAFIGITISINAQIYRDGHIDPDSLNQITVSGTVNVDETTTHPSYYLDENSDGSLDYRLNFGPYWYEPDSSVAERPLDGDIITVSGVVHDSYNTSEQTIIVYEINGEFWRDPYFAYWNNLGNHSHQLGGHHGGMMGYGFGWEHDTITSIEANGTVFVDTTLFMNHYQLDEDGDAFPDYYLNFGPFWYEPESGIERPANGENISILGGLLENSSNIPMLIVYEINGEIWRDSSLGDHFGGGWFHADMSDSQTFHSPFDVHDQMTIREGWGGQGHMGGMNNFDSLFCQLFEVYPENIPNMQEITNVLAAYEIHIFDPNGNSLMRNGGKMGGHMQFGSNVKYQLHYSDKQLKYYEADETSVHAKYWDNQNNSWLDANAIINTESNILVFENNIISNFVILDFSEATTVNQIINYTPKEFALSQNYPNPFNPTTTIKYSLPYDSHVSLRIYDLLGNQIKTLVNQSKSEGTHSTEFNAEGLSTGIYFYTLNAGNNKITKKLILIK